MKKPRILIISDVPGWAWERKAKQLQKHLSNEFHIEIINAANKGNLGKTHPKFDLYLTFSVRDIAKIMDVPIEKRISGLTVYYPDLHEKLQNVKNEVAYVHANNLILYNEIKKYFKHCFYTPNGVDHEFFRPLKECNNEELVVGHVAKPAPWKGFEDFIKPAIDKANKIIPIKLKTNHRKHKNAITEAEMLEWYQDVDVFIMASGKEEGTPNPMLEMASCGKTVIGTKYGNIPEFVVDGYNGFTVDRTIDEFAKKLIVLAENKELCKYLGENARKTIEKDWTWKKQSENYRIMFKKVLGI